VDCFLQYAFIRAGSPGQVERPFLLSAGKTKMAGNPGDYRALAGKAPAPPAVLFLAVTGDYRAALAAYIVSLPWPATKGAFHTGRKNKV